MQPGGDILAQSGQASSISSHQDLLVISAPGGLVGQHATAQGPGAGGRGADLHHLAGGQGGVPGGAGAETRARPDTPGGGGGGGGTMHGSTLQTTAGGGGSAGWMPASQGDAAWPAGGSSACGMGGGFIAVQGAVPPGWGGGGAPRHPETRQGGQGRVLIEVLR
jgi:hypothetical protein